MSTVCGERTSKTRLWSWLFPDQWAVHSRGSSQSAASQGFKVCGSRATWSACWTSLSRWGNYCTFISSLGYISSVNKSGQASTYTQCVICGYLEGMMIGNKKEIDWCRKWERGTRRKRNKESFVRIVVLLAIHYRTWKISLGRPPLPQRILLKVKKIKQKIIF